MVDTRDIAEVAIAELLRRKRATGALPRVDYDLVGPDNLTGPDLAALWSEALGRPVRYAEAGLDAFETQLRDFAPSWLAYERRVMMRRYQENGATVGPEVVARLTALLGHPPRRYRAFAAETAQAWREA